MIEELARIISGIAPEYLKDKRWFLRKRDEIKKAVFVDGWTAKLSANEILVNSIVEIGYAGGGPDKYFLPLMFVRGNGTDNYSGSSLISHAQFNGAGYSVYEPLNSTAYFEYFMDSFWTGLKFETLSGGGSCVEFKNMLGSNRRDLGAIRQYAGELSNTIVFLDEAEAVKIYRRLPEGINPGIEVYTRLNEFKGSPVPPFLGYAVYRSAGGREYVLSLVESFVKNSGDAWQYFLGKIKEYAAAPDGVEKYAGGLGETIARLHYNMFMAFGAGAFEQSDAAKWKMRLKESIVFTAKHIPEISSELEKSISIVERIADFGMKIRIHGDLHLGQILKTSCGYCVIDFEGEPLKTPDEHRGKNSPLKDVAGLLRSFNYASNYFIKKQNGGAPAAYEWEKKVRSIFLESYFETVKKLGCGFLPGDKKSLKEMLAVYELEKAMYELEYEINSRPGWIDVPLGGIKGVLKELENLAV